MQFRVLDSTIAISCQHLYNKFAAFLIQNMPFVNSERPHPHSHSSPSEISSHAPITGTTCNGTLSFALNLSLYQFHSVLHTVHAYGCMSSTEVMAPIYITPACLATAQREIIKLYMLASFQ